MSKYLEAAITIAGGQINLAKMVGTTQPVISYWLRKSKNGVPAEYCAAIEQATNGAVRRSQLRPDVFGDQP